MLSFGALNAPSSSEESTGHALCTEVHKEEQEAEALALYNQALSFQRIGDIYNARCVYENLLKTALISEAPESLADGEDFSKHPALFLKYNVMKNLGGIAQAEGESERAVDYYLAAAVVDESDVSLLLKIGNISMSSLNMRLARYAFEKGLTYSPNHWPCLDNLITVLFVVGDYYACLRMIALAFERDNSYIKGFALRDQIFKEEAHFKKDFMQTSILFLNEDEEQQEAREKYVEEALIMREKRLLLTKREELPKVKFNKPFFYLWSSLGDALLTLYEELSGSSQAMALGMTVDLDKYFKTAEQQASIVLRSPDVTIKKTAKGNSKDEECRSLKRKKPVASTLFEKEADPQPKRRSTRVRTTKPKENDVSWFDLIGTHLPLHLKLEASSMETEDSQDSLSDFVDGAKSASTSSKPTVASPEALKKEATDVSNFINGLQQNSGIIHVIQSFLMRLAEDWNVKWSAGVSYLYQRLYRKIRKHIQFPVLFSDESDDRHMCTLSKMILVGLEIDLDFWLLSKRSVQGVSASPSPVRGSSLGTQIPKEQLMTFLSDMQYVGLAGASNPILCQASPDFRIRHLWLRGRFSILLEDLTMARDSLLEASEALLAAGKGLESVQLPNCMMDHVISRESIKEKLESLQRSQSLDDLQTLFAEKKYVEIIVVLEPVLYQRPQKSTINPALSSAQRQAHFLLLIQSYLHTAKYSECISCADHVLMEVVPCLSSLEPWKDYLLQLLTCLESCFAVNDVILAANSAPLASITRSLIKIIEFSMDSENSDAADLAALTWHTLYSVIKCTCAPNQTKIQDAAVPDVSNVIELEKSFPLSFIREAHEHLGRKGWCCCNQGLLLLQFVKDIEVELKKPLEPSMKLDLNSEMEQCFVCLYGNPKKSKVKGMQDHCTDPISLSWEYAKKMYSFYKPDDLPELDLKTHTISVEVQNVFRKIATVVPQKDVEIFSFEVLQQYIDGGEALPPLSDAGLSRSCDVDDLFYYLGDFYFKNKEFNKALKYYMHDLCINPRRFQSWAAMALARGTRLEEKISMCEPRSDGTIKKHVTATLRCYERAIDIRSTRCVIMEEYGATAYMLNSYYARRLREDKQDFEQVTASQENFVAKRTEMLELAETCFQQAQKLATDVSGEPWFHSYMLGKAAEKLNRPPDIYLQHYQKSLEELHRCDGEFLKRIPYHGPPSYSIEAVEIFYRIHASIMKLLLRSDALNCIDVAEKHLGLATKQPIYLEWIAKGFDGIDANGGVESINAMNRADVAATSYTAVGTSSSTDSALAISTSHVRGFAEVSCTSTRFSSIATACEQALVDTARDPIVSYPAGFERPSGLAAKTGEVSRSDSRIPTVVASPKALFNDRLESHSELAASDLSNRADVLTARVSDICGDFCSDGPMTEAASVQYCPSESSLDLVDFVSGLIEKVSLLTSGEDCPLSPRRSLPSGSSDMEIISLRCEKDCESAAPAFTDGISGSPVCTEMVSTWPGKPNSDFEAVMQSETGRVRFVSIIDRCLRVFAFCLLRFPEHYKSQYRMAKVLASIPTHLNLLWSRDLLMGGQSTDMPEYSIPLPSHGIFSGKKKTNLFQGLWRIPVGEIDRPGSFCSHISRCVDLLLDVLHKLGDCSMLLHVSGMLHRTPEKDKKYLRDNDRTYLGVKAFGLALEAFGRKMSQVSKYASEIEKSQLLLDIYEAYRHAQKLQCLVKKAEQCLVQSYRVVVASQVDDLSDAQLIEDAAKFCFQKVEAMKKQSSLSSATIMPTREILE